MPVYNEHSSAGVYAGVKDLSAGATSLSTAVVGMCGQARRGPVNQRVAITDEDDLKNIFGLKDPKYGLGLYVALPISQQTNQLYYVRLVKNAKYAVAVLTVDDPTAVKPVLRLNNLTDDDGNILGVNSPDELGFLPGDILNENTIGYIITENPGDWNNNMALQIRPAVPKGLDAFDDRTKYNTKLFYIDEFENYVPGSVAVSTHTCCLKDYKDDFNKQYRVGTVFEDESSNFRFIQNEYFTTDIDFLTTDFVFLKGGSDGDKVTSDDLSTAYQTYYSDPEECRVTLLVSGGIEDYIIHRGMKLAADNHLNCHVIGCVPTDQQTVAKAIRYRKQTLNLSARNMSLYTPDIKIFDTDTGRYLTVPCAGQIAAVYCYTDNNRGSWFAPAGIKASEVLDILGLTQKYDQDDRDAMTRELLNYVRKLPEQAGGGFAVWEANTLLATTSAFQQIQIQRMVGYVLEVCQKSCKVGLFDPNDDILRQYLKGIVEKFLEEIKLARGLRSGKSGSQGYVVVCDRTNNTNATIANGDLVLDIVLDPTRTTKRLIYRFNINPKGSTSTVLGEAA
ncbi:putative tail sheath protein [Erwinia phage vB_EamM_Yoloswag]|uniref:Putative tail sheath protein n=1 Tax=Erwinia phage vB_EamM_Yoloswag TaxID=1958956 RepID=A0A1S6L388_9CAUD|nr:putative tail sheath protein [Erwinia phage vB_EamM_Yoloswag]AQT28636.1 putative tail sheath protein [Erwinia phage vB_EamM_Yoloswag]